MLRRQVGIPQCGRDADMPDQFFDGIDRHTRHDQMRDIGVPEGMDTCPGIAQFAQYCRDAPAHPVRRPAGLIVRGTEQVAIFAMRDCIDHRCQRRIFRK